MKSTTGRSFALLIVVMTNSGDAPSFKSWAPLATGSFADYDKVPRQEGTSCNSGAVDDDLWRQEDAMKRLKESEKLTPRLAVLYWFDCKPRQHSSLGEEA